MHVLKKFTFDYNFIGPNTSPKTITWVLKPKFTDRRILDNPLDEMTPNFE